MRLALVQLSSTMTTDYKGIVYYLNTFFKKMIAKYSPEPS